MPPTLSKLLAIPLRRQTDMTQMSNRVRTTDTSLSGSFDRPRRRSYEERLQTANRLFEALKLYYPDRRVTLSDPSLQRSNQSKVQN